MAGKLFISYRRADTKAWAGRIRDRLKYHFRELEIFMDVYDIQPGENFSLEIDEAVSSCDVLIALIGPQWLSVKDSEGNKRLDNPNDLVRIEIGTALNREIQVIPLLFDRAEMPQKSQLSDDLKALCEINALSISHKNFEPDFKLLNRSIESYLAPASIRKHIRLNEFQALIDDRIREFFGREYIFNEIDKIINDPIFPSGYILIKGEPGIGKTSIIAQLVKQRGYIYHFNIIAENIRSTSDFLSNICAQLIIRYDLDYATIPEEASQDTKFLKGLLEEASNKEPNDPIIILVDALDEADNFKLA